MYFRADHSTRDLPTLYDFIRANPLGNITTAIPSSVFPLIQSTYVPLVLDEPEAGSATETYFGTLRGHLARENPHTKTLIETAKEELAANEEGNAGTTAVQLKQEVMILFNSPVQHYITPQFYAATKPDTGKVVPTWDYATVQAYGLITVHLDSSSGFLTKQVDDLTKACEGRMGFAEEKSWKVNDAPERYLEIMKKRIVGFSIDITRIAGKFKMSQELGKGDRDGVVTGFQNLGTEVGEQMAESVSQWGERKKANK